MAESIIKVLCIDKDLKEKITKSSSFGENDWEAISKVLQARIEVSDNDEKEHYEVDLKNILKITDLRFQIEKEEITILYKQEQAYILCDSN